MRLNHAGVLTATAIHQLLGFLWYSPQLFFGAWARAFRLDPAGLKQGIILPLIFALFASLTYNYLFAWFMKRLNLRGPFEAVELTIYIWFPLVGLGMTSHYLFAQIPWSGILIEIGGIFLNVIVSALIISLWVKK